MREYETKFHKFIELGLETKTLALEFITDCLKKVEGHEIEVPEDEELYVLDNQWDTPDVVSLVSVYLEGDKLKCDMDGTEGLLVSLLDVHEVFTIAKFCEEKANPVLN